MKLTTRKNNELILKFDIEQPQMKTILDSVEQVNLDNPLVVQVVLSTEEGSVEFEFPVLGKKAN